MPWMAKGRCCPGGVQHHRGDGVDHRVLLHIQQEELVHGALEELPQHADGHGEAEGHNGHEHGGEGQGKALMPVEQVHQGEADGGTEKPVEGVEHGVPVGEGGVVRLDLPRISAAKIKSRMMISSVLGRSIWSLRSRTVGSRSRISVRIQRNTFSKFPLKNWATMTRMTSRRSTR